MVTYSKQNIGVVIFYVVCGTLLGLIFSNKVLSVILALFGVWIYLSLTTIKKRIIWRQYWEEHVALIMFVNVPMLVSFFLRSEDNVIRHLVFFIGSFFFDVLFVNFE